MKYKKCQSQVRTIKFRIKKIGWYSINILRSILINHISLKFIRRDVVALYYSFTYNTTLQLVKVNSQLVRTRDPSPTILLLSSSQIL